ncbi:Hsp33 family molecular chaperone HslO [Sphingomonas flavalba]|uniref:Hsp33 family molecular chaperone HslO n=1 Tax=Sphingomonas flavalba TaxID=2559804 RepID=UPI00109E1E2D|nr:Hsp33 family molecular chaperone HslO [Sphingomonas flavalba]
MPAPAASPATAIDLALGFAIPGQDARGRFVRLGPTLDAILAAHAYPLRLEALLAEALVLTALFGTTLKDEGGQMTLQAQTEGGVVDLLVCDYRAGALRGYLQFDADRFAEAPADPSLFALFGKGYLAITFDQAVTGERYQGIVPLEGGSLAAAAEAYFAQSEQIPSLVRIAIAGGAGRPCVAGGMLVQHLPGGETGRDRLHARIDQGQWDHVAALAGTIKAVELTDPALPLETLVWRLFHDEDEVRLLGETAIGKGCRCDPAHIASVLARFPAEERAAMADADGIIGVDCAFCARTFPVPLASLAAAGDEPT